MAGIYRVMLKNEIFILLRADDEIQIRQQFNINEIDGSILKLRDFDTGFRVDLDLSDNGIDFEFHDAWLMQEVPIQLKAHVNEDCIDCVKKTIGDKETYYCKNLFIRMQAARVSKEFQVLTGCCKRFPKAFMMELRQNKMSRHEKYGH